MRRVKAAIVHIVPYRKPTQVDEGENPKAGGRSIAKELGKMAPQLREKVPASRPQENDSKQLFWQKYRSMQ